VRGSTTPKCIYAFERREEQRHLAMVTVLFRSAQLSARFVEHGCRLEVTGRVAQGQEGAKAK
jgi:hypothetical protein